MTLTPAPGGALAYGGTCASSVNVTLSLRGIRFPTYTDANGQLQPVEVKEWYKGRDFRQDSNTVKYSRVFLIHGTFETTDCVDIGPLIGDEDDVLPGYFVSNRKLSWYAQGGGSSDVVKLEVDYAPPQEPQSSGGDSEGTYTFDFTSESETVDLAINQTHYGEQPNAGEDKLINFDGESVEGVQVDSPILSFTEERAFSESEFTPAFRAQLTAAVKKTNSAVWRGFEIESVLFDGASASKRNKTWIVQFRFRARLGFTNKVFTVIDDNAAVQNVSVTKPGWRYLWVSMAKRSDGAAEPKFQVAPAAIHVAQVYETLNFATLGIGVDPMN